MNWKREIQSKTLKGGIGSKQDIVRLPEEENNSTFYKK